MSVRLHQALHGYRDGHRLLQSSVDLPPMAQRVLQELSDLSGPGWSPGFESYLTGYPLPDTGLYVLATTWLAPEMPRRGCVWTHSLLLDAEAIRTGNFSRLLSLFKRPSGPNGLANEYRHPLDVTFSRAPGEAVDAAAGTLTETSVTAVLTCLYAVPYQPAAMIAASSTEFEAAIVRAWERQWNSLRAAFTFCTGAIAPRTLLDRPFDLQVVPRGADKLWLHELSKPSGPQAKEDSSQGWLSLATHDLVEPGGPLGRFIDEVGPELPARRPLFQPLVELHQLLESDGAGPSRVSSVRDHLLRWFPGGDVLANFKAAFYSREGLELQKAPGVGPSLSSRPAMSAQAASQAVEAPMHVEDTDPGRHADQIGNGPAIAAVLDRVNETGAMAQLDALALDWNSESAAIGDWLKSARHVRPETLDWFARHLSPSSHALKYAGTAPWLRVARLRGSGEESWSTQTFWAFVFVLALQCRDGGALELALRGFEPIHSLATRDRLSTEAWSTVERMLPPNAFARDLDRGDRLCQALLNGLLEHSWLLADARLQLSQASIRALAQTARSDDWYRSLRPRIMPLLKGVHTT